MKPQYQHNVTTSFALWLDHYLLQKGEAYTNQTGRFYYYQDARLPSTYKAFGTEYRQWVYDSTITGATIPSGVFINSTFTPRSSALKIDFLNGRVLATGAGVPTGAAVTGRFSVKDFNIYLSNENEEDLIIEKNISSQKKFPWSGATYLAPYDQTLPAIYIMSDSFENTPFSFGGEDETRSMMRSIVFADDPYSLDGVLSIFADSKNRVFKQKDFGSYPINEFGDIKTPPFSFDDYYTNPDPSVELFIDDVTVSKFKDSRGSARSYIGFLDFEVINYRYPRA